jgi:putative nucleotidyltransferase with HDIG domain
MTTLAATSLETRLNQIISNIRNLPTPPIVFEQIQRVINNPETPVAEVGKIISEDPAISVKILKLTNSAFYGLSRQVDSIKHAVMIIGLEAVKNLVLSASVLGMFKVDNLNKEYQEDFWRHSLSTALAARMIARTFKEGRVFNPDSAFSVGLLHDIGKMVTCCFLKKEHSQVQEYLSQHSEITDIDAEIAVMGFNHAQLGRQLAISWKLPVRMAETIGYHHHPDMKNESGDYAHLINLTDCIAHYAYPSKKTELRRYRVNQITGDYFKVDEPFFEKARADLYDEYAKAEIFIKIAGI